VRRGLKLVCVVVLCLLGAMLVLPFIRSLMTLAAQVQLGWRPTPRAVQVAAEVAAFAVCAWRPLHGPVRGIMERRRNPHAADLDVLISQLERAADKAVAAAAAADAIGVSGRRVRRARRSASRARKTIGQLRWVRRNIDLRPHPADVEDIKEASSWRADVLRAGWRTLRRTHAATGKVNATVKARRTAADIRSGAPSKTPSPR
jgi:hypothetical protein